MLARIFALLPLALYVSASHLEAREQCGNGSLNCCNSVQNYQSALPYLTKKGIDLAHLHLDATTLLGIQCSPITGVGVSGTSCTQQTTCCTGNSYNGVVNVGCTPININL